MTLLSKATATASACVASISKQLGESWRLWEPETIWVELNHRGIDVPLINREKILASRSLLNTGRFWYDMHAFERTAIAFSSDEISDMGIEDAPVAYINWAVFEANLLHTEYEKESLEFEHEAIRYTAVQLYREGFAYAPPMLSWAQPALDRMYRGSNEALKNKMQKAWASAPKSIKELDAPYPETESGVQLARLAAVEVHFHTLLQQRQKELATLTS